MEEEKTSWDMPEQTKKEIIEKISALAREIRNDWSDPRSECRKIVELCKKLIDIESAEEKVNELSKAAVISSFCQCEKPDWCMENNVCGVCNKDIKAPRQNDL